MSTVAIMSSTVAMNGGDNVTMGTAMVANGADHVVYALGLPSPIPALDAYYEWTAIILVLCASLAAVGTYII